MARLLEPRKKRPPVCPYCGSRNVGPHEDRATGARWIFICRDCNKTSNYALVKDSGVTRGSRLLPMQ